MSEHQSDLPIKPPRTTRIAVAVCVGVAAGLIAWVKVRQHLLYDFAYFWVAGRALLDGTNPYTAVRPGVMQFDNWFMYPLPAAMAGAAVAWLPLNVAGILFVGVMFGLVAWALTHDGWNRLPILMSAPALWSMTAGQWAPLVVAAAVSPAFAWAAVAKPTLGLASFAYRPSWRFIWVAVVTVLISLAIRPDWPLSWWEATRKAAAFNYAIPLFQPWGWLLALSIFRWRAPEGRLLLCMACMPQSMLMYDQFLLLLVARTRMEAIAFSLWSHLVPLAIGLLTVSPALDTKAQTFPFMARVLTFTLYLPALVVVLRRPNDGPVPAWLERVKGLARGTV